jgi:hypothetical protein
MNIDVGLDFQLVNMTAWKAALPWCKYYELSTEYSIEIPGADPIVRTYQDYLDVTSLISPEQIVALKSLNVIRDYPSCKASLGSSATCYAACVYGAKGGHTCSGDSAYQTWINDTNPAVSLLPLGSCYCTLHTHIPVMKCDDSPRVLMFMKASAFSTFTNGLNAIFRYEKTAGVGQSEYFGKRSEIRTYRVRYETGHDTGSAILTISPPFTTATLHYNWGIRELTTDISGVGVQRIPIPQDILKMGGQLALRIEDATGEVWQDEYPFTGEDWCTEVYRMGYFTYSAYRYASSCIPWYWKLFHFIGILALIGFFLMICLPTYMGAKMILMDVLYILCFPCAYGWRRRTKLRKYRNRGLGIIRGRSVPNADSSDEEEEEREQSDVEKPSDERPGNRKSRSQTGVTPLTATFVLFLLFAPLVLCDTACGANSIVQAFDTSTCTLPSSGVHVGQLECTLSTDLNLIIPGAGTTTCATLYPAGHNESAVSLTVTRVTDISTFSLDVAIATSKVHIREYVTHKCHGSDYCVMGNTDSPPDCTGSPNGTALTHDWSLNGQLAGGEATYNWPGWSTCSRGCAGGLGEPCAGGQWNCLSSTGLGCRYSTYAYDVGYEGQYIIMNVGVVVYTYSLNVTITYPDPTAESGSTTKIFILALDSGELETLPLDASTGTWEIIDVTPAVATETITWDENRRIICPEDQSEWAEWCIMGLATDGSSSSPTTPGAIWWNWVPGQMPGQGRSSFNYDPNLCKITTAAQAEATDIVNCYQDPLALAYTKIGVDQPYSQAPYMVEGQTFTIYQGSGNVPSLRSTTLGLGTMEVTLSTPSDMTVYTDVTNVNFKITYDSSGGCYACDQGAWFTVDITETEGSGGAVYYYQTSGDNVTLPSGQITAGSTQQAETKKIGFFSSSKTGSFVVRFCWNLQCASTQDITVSFVLTTANGTIGPQPHNQTGGGNGGSGGGGQNAACNNVGALDKFLCGLGNAVAGVFGGSGGFWSTFLTVLFWIAVLAVALTVLIIVIGCVTKPKIHKS